VTQPRLPWVLDSPASSVAAPAGLPLVALPWSPGLLVPLLSVAGAGLLIARGRRAAGDQRPRLTWAVAAGGILALLLLATPAGTLLLGQLAWNVIFLVAASIIPFVLTAGLLGHRLMEVDRLVGQILSRGAVLVLALSGYAAVVAAGWHGWVAAVVVVLVALTGGPLVQRLEHVVDRRLTGGRVRGSALVHHLVEALESSAPGQVAQRTADTVVEGLDVAWVRVVLHGGTLARSGSAPQAGDPTEPVLVVALDAGDATVGRLECGPRRGGWGELDLAQLRVLARHAALTLHAGELSAALAGQVEQLHASRVRLVQAEQRVRRQLERDLHDGVQQQLVALLSRLGALEVLMEPGSPGAGFVMLAKEQAEMSLAELRELVRGIYPPLLADRGLVAALRSRAALLPLRVQVTADPDVEWSGLAAETETAAYYVASEALTNVVKHARADTAEVELRLSEGTLVVGVRDDGAGMTDGSLAVDVPTGGLSGGHGLAGLRDRVEALGGSLSVLPRASGGTELTASLPSGVGR
jgi:signal transduction histidine kinase